MKPENTGHRQFSYICSSWLESEKTGRSVWLRDRPVFSCSTVFIMICFPRNQESYHEICHNLLKQQTLAHQGQTQEENGSTQLNSAATAPIQSIHH